MQKKASILALYEILNKHSDQQHPLKRKEIEYLLELEYDLKLDRKTLHDHVKLLNEFGCDINTPQSINDGYYLNSRLFEPSEIHLLCNAIYAVHFIPQKASNDLIEKLLNTQSKYLKSDFHQTVYMKNMRKSLNKEFFLNVEILIEAIQENKPVSFNYMRYNLNKILINRKNHEYIIHPYYIIYANENYYLICNNNEYEGLSHYRIDKMKDIKVLTDLQRKSLQKSFDPYVYAKSKIYMYGGEEERITLKCDYFILDNIIDRFGNDVILQEFDEKHFLAIIRSSKQGILYLCLQYLKYCEVTAPLDLRNEIHKILKETLQTYE
ncbi:helix-turn-helix transcriptional regulator [Amedibacillus sp. YH-ame6]